MSLAPVAIIRVTALLRASEFSRAIVSMTTVSRSAWWSSMLRKPPTP